MKKLIPIGISDFKQLIEGGYAYVDKSLFIQELLEKGAVVSLISRMRRFGKTLNLSMLRYFFEKTDQDHSFLFQDLKIWKEIKFRGLQGQFPVIFISFKDIKQFSWNESFELFSLLIAKEFERHNYLLSSDILSAAEKEDFLKITHKEAQQPLIEQSLLILTEWLYRFHKKRVILLIDEYDTLVGH